jgi:hypothetical protein
MITLRVAPTLAADIPTVIGLLDAGAFASPTRSTLPLLDYWREPEARLHDLGKALGWPLLPSADLTFEFQVPVREGRGKPSFTDLMIVTPDCALAIEAKYTEPRYETVHEWLGCVPTRNREAVLQGWIRHVESATACRVNKEAVHALPYQLIHRTASVCSVARPARAVIYQVFGDTVSSHYARDLAMLAHALPGNHQLRFYVMSVAVHPSPGLMRLSARDDTTDRAARIRSAMLEGPLFAFGDVRTVHVT